MTQVFIDAGANAMLVGGLETYKSYGSNQPVTIALNEYLPVDFPKRIRGSIDDYIIAPVIVLITQGMVEEKIIKGYPVFQDEENSWASGLSVEAGTNGLILLKESNETVNQ